MAAVLTFKQYLGGSDNVQVIEMLPEHQKTFTYDFDSDITGFTFGANYSSVVLDTITYDRTTGDPNFADSKVIGYLGNTSTTIDPTTYINVLSASAGTVNFTIPKNRYTGWIYPDARTNVVMTIVEFAWTSTGVTPNTTDSHRWGIIERYTSDVIAGNPTTTGVSGNTVAFTDITGA
tara:strand:+ start:156 stop:686 length:531 start_codon:yes stop_codon:yes gene_type:complete